jgi:subtilisin family serine protease
MDTRTRRHTALPAAICGAFALAAPAAFASFPNDPLVTTNDPLTQLPHEWQFTAAHVDRALDYTHGSASVRVGIIDSSAADVPDLAGKVDQRWTVSAMGKVKRETTPTDLEGHGTAVASLIAATSTTATALPASGATAISSSCTPGH